MTTINTKILLEKSKKFLNIIDQLYASPPEVVIKRIADLVSEHNKWCMGESLLFSSPGRIEVAGNHTDHNNGAVVAAAVSVDTLACVTPSDDNWIIIKSKGYADVIVGIDDLEYHEEEKGTSHAMVRGILRCYADRGYKIGSFSATTVSDVFKGAGMSSSASFEVLVTEILNVLYNDGKIAAMERASISQFAENIFFGKPSGLMDQAAIALGGINYIDFENPTAPYVRKLNFIFDDIMPVVINCGGDHCNLTENYAAIKSDMESIAKFYGKDKLRQVNETTFRHNIKTLKQRFSGRAILRALHFFEEHARSKKIAAAVASVEKKEFLSLINASGLSSYKKLQNIYPEGDPQEPVALALAIVESTEGVVASRVHGGGFAGTILTFVEKTSLDAFVRSMDLIFGSENVFAVKIRRHGAIKIDL
ncbi:MAG: galactokinase [Christensenellaceae bacterium]|jgi:galactokinase|nr:galactokinase [Christensenellaceae bacterium]